MAANADSPPPAQRPKSSPLSAILWPIGLFVVLMLYIQWPEVQDLYYRVSGTEPPKGAIAWRDDFDAALAEAGSSDKPVLLVFSATWCGPCNNMKRNVWSDDEVGKSVAARFVPVHIDVDDPQPAEIANRYSVRTIPAIFVLDADGEVLARGSYMSRSETLAFLAETGKPQ